MTKQEHDKLTELIKQNPGMGRRKLSQASGISVNRVQAWLKNKKWTATSSTKVTTTTSQPKNAVGRTIAEFRNTFDKSTIVPKKIKEGLKALGPQGWEYEALFVKFIGVSPADLGNFRDQFSDYIVTMKERRAWAGSKKTAELLKGML